MGHENENGDVDFATHLAKHTDNHPAYTLNLRHFQAIGGRGYSLTKLRPAGKTGGPASPTFTSESVTLLLRSSPPSDFQDLYHWFLSDPARPVVLSLLTEESFLEALSSAVSAPVNRESFWYLSQIIVHLVALDDSTLIDLGIVLTIHELLGKYQADVLGLYCQLAGLSVYAGNAIACTGILSDVVKLCGRTADPDLQVLAAQVIYSVCRHDDPIPEEDLGLPDILALLKLPNSDAVFFVICALVDIIVTMRGALVSELFNQRVHVFVATAIANPHLRGPSLILAGNMGTCEPAELKLLSDCGVITAIIGCAKESECLSSVLWGLSNCIRSDPELMLPLVPQELVDLAQGLGGTAQYNDAVVFLATLMLFCPLQYVSGLVDPKGIEFLVKALKCEAPTVRVRVLDALGRILFLGITNEDMKFTVPIIRDSINLSGGLCDLTTVAEKLIASKASTLWEEIQRSSEESL